MFEYFKGTLVEKTAVSAVIECHGIGYFVNISVNTYEKLPGISNQTKLYIHTAVNDEGTRLFGFFDKIERDLFRKLISISRIGPKIALSILSTFDVNQFIQAIHEKDVRLISSVPGLGKKSAERLVLELKDKVKNISDFDNSGIIPKKKDIFMEVETALITLGYKVPDIRKVINSFSQEKLTLSTEELIKLAIKSLYKKRNT